jgi:hypothetical protein
MIGIGASDVADMDHDQALAAGEVGRWREST